MRSSRFSAKVPPKTLQREAVHEADIASGSGRPGGGRDRRPGGRPDRGEPGAAARAGAGDDRHQPLQEGSALHHRPLGRLPHQLLGRVRPAAHPLRGRAAPGDREVIIRTPANPAKQVADIEICGGGVDLILYWPVDEQAIQEPCRPWRGSPRSAPGASRRPAARPTRTSTSGTSASCGAQAVRGPGGQGKIFAMLPIAGTTAAVDQLALETVTGVPDIEHRG
jgi:hypothetical protein